MIPVYDIYSTYCPIWRPCCVCYVEMILDSTGVMAHAKLHQPISAFTSRQCCSIFTVSLLPVSLQGTSSLTGDDWHLDSCQKEPWALVELSSHLTAHSLPQDVNTTPANTSAAPALSLSSSKTKATAVWVQSADRDKCNRFSITVENIGFEIVLLNLLSAYN